MARKRVTKPMDQLQDILEAMPEEFLECRESHMWVRKGSSWNSKLGCYVRIRRCARCGTIKYVRVNSVGGPAGATYDHPDGYLIQGLGRLQGGYLGALRLFDIQREVTIAEHVAEETKALNKAKGK